MIGLPEWFQLLPGVVANLPTPLHWNPFEDLPLPAQDRSHNAGQQPAVVAPPIGRQVVNLPDDAANPPTTSKTRSVMPTMPPTCRRLRQARLQPRHRSTTRGRSRPRWSRACGSWPPAARRASGRRRRCSRFTPLDRQRPALRTGPTRSSAGSTISAATPCERPPPCPTATLAGKLRRTGFALARRVDIWRQLLRLDHDGATGAPFAEPDPSGWQNAWPRSRP